MGQVLPFRADAELSAFAREYIDDLSEVKRSSKTKAWNGSGVIMPPLALNYEQMRRVVERVPVLSAIINTRVAQISHFCRLQETPNEPGFKILHRDQNHKITPDELLEIDALTRFIMMTTRDEDIDSRVARGIQGFRQLIMMSARDSLILDSNPIELVYDDDGLLESFYAVDGATIKIRGPNEDNIAYVQESPTCGRVNFTSDQLIYVPRNPSADVYRAGYGTSEIEQLLTVITGFANAITYNNAVFSRSSIPRGFLTIPGATTGSDELVEFGRQLTNWMRGAENAHKIPIFGSAPGSDGPIWTSTDNNVSDMFFERYMTFLASIACAVYQMSPDEINFGSFSTSGSLNGESVLAKLEHSKAKGLLPLLNHFEDIITSRILSQWSDKYVFRFCGLYPETKDLETEKVILSVSTINEIRAKHGLPAVEWGNQRYTG